MHDIHTRMTSLHLLLTGGPHQPAWQSTYPPQYLWGDIGLDDQEARAPRRSLRSRLRFW